MIKVKDGYAKLIGTTYSGSADRVLLSNGGDFSIHTGRNNEVNKLVRTDGSGYIQAGWINTTSGNFTGTPDRIYASNDGYIRYMTPANFRANVIGNNYWKVNAQTTAGTGDIYLEMWRGTNASWKMLNTGGILKFQSNYTSAAGSYFDVLNLEYNSGNGWLKGYLTSAGFIKNGSSSAYALTGDGGHKQWSTSSTANTLVARDANQYIYATYYNSNIGNEDGMTLGSVYVRNNSDNWIRRMSYSKFVENITNSIDSRYIRTHDMMNSACAIIPTYNGETGWHRIATINGSAGYGSYILYLCGNWSYASNTNAIIHIDTMHTTAQLTQVSGIVGYVSSVRLVNVSNNQYYVDVYINYSGANTPGTVYCYFLGNGTITPRTTAEKITASVTASAEIALQSGGRANNIVVNNSDSNSTYRMVWHSGNTLYSTGGIYCNPSTDYLYATSMNASDWFRSSGTTGWYNPTNNCHVYPNAATTYGGLMLRGEKGGYTGFILGTSTNYMNLMDNGTDKGLYQEGKGWILYYNRSNNYVGIRTSSLSDPLTVAGITRVVASDKYLRIGPQNSSHAHYETNATVSHWFNKTVQVDGNIEPYGNNEHSAGSTSYRFSNVYSYLGNFAGTVSINCAWPNIVCNNNASGATESNIRFEVGGANKGYVGYSTSNGTYLYNSAAGKYVYINGNGYFYTQSYIYVGAGNEKNASNPPYVWGVNGSDNFMRTYATSSLRVANADTLDDLHASAFMRHRGWWNSGDSHSADGIATGMYFAYSSHGVPNHWGTLVTFAYQESASYNLQLHGTGDNYLYYRNRSSDYGQKPWKRLADADELKNPADYYWANIKVSASSSTSTSPTFATATMTRGVVGGYNNTSYALSTASFICNSWIRTVGSTGWYNESYGGGWYMTDSTYVRSYNDKRVYNANTSQYAFYTAGGMTAVGNMYAARFVATTSNAYQSNGGLILSNSDIWGLNAIYTADLADGAGEGYQFKRSNGNYDSIWCKDGYHYFSPNGHPDSGYSANYPVLVSSNDGNGYPVILRGDGTCTWIRVGGSDTYGILPYTSGGAGSGHSYIGTSSWYFKYAYIDNIYGTVSNVTVNSSDANSTYRMVWHSGNTLYGTNNIYCNPSTDQIYSAGFRHVSYNSASYLLRSDGGAAAFNWSGQSGQPTYVWGGNSQHTYYVYNPSNFSVLKSNKTDQLEAYTSSDFTGGNHFVRAIRYDSWHTRLYMGYYRDATLQNTVHVGYADNATNSTNATNASYLNVHDVRNATRLPDYFAGKKVTAWFNNTGTPDGNWYSGLHVKGWDTGYTSWELCSYSSTGTANDYNLFFRNGNNSTWGSWKYIPTSSTAAKGSATNGVYISGGKFNAMTYSLNATVNSGTASKIAYYSGANAISCYTSSKGSTTKGMYLNAGVPTEMTYSLSATVNSGTASRLAYYSSATAISGLAISASTSTLYIVGVLSGGHIPYSATQSTISGVSIRSGNTVYAAGGFYESSDERLKTFLTDVTVDLEKLRKLPKKYFKWCSNTMPQGIQLGTSAQAVQEIYPELVTTNELGYLHVAYDKLSVVALKAIDTLYDMVLDIKKENELLKARIEYLENKL